MVKKKRKIKLVSWNVNGLRAVFKKEFVKFYSNYNCSQEIDSMVIFNFLVDNDVYNLIRTLRKNELTVNDCLSYLNNREELFEELLEKKNYIRSNGKRISVYRYSVY